MEYRLRDVCKIITKGTTPKKDDGFQINGINFIKSESLNYNGFIDKKTFSFISENVHKNYLKRSILENDDILFSIAGVYLGKIGIVSKDILPANTNQAIAIIRVNQTLVLSKYIFYYLQQKNIIAFINNSVSQSAQPNINLSQLGDLKIEVPSINIQSEIIEILYNIDLKIELNNKINDNLHEIVENLFLKIYNQGEETKLEKLLFEVQSGSRSKGGAINSGIPSIGAEKIEKLGAYDFSSEKYISEEYYDKMKNGIVKSGDVLLYKDGAYTGKVSMALNDFPHKKCAVNEHVFILRTENNWANNYLYFLLYYSKTQEQISSMARSKAAQPGLNQTELKSAIVNIPNKEIIEDFEEKVKPLVNKIFQNSTENRTLTELKDTLLPKLMNGEINLDNTEI